MFGHTPSTKTAEIEKKWVIIDAKGLVVGRLASIVAMRLRGKHKPSFTPHIDHGDNVIVVNADKVVNRPQARAEIFYHYTGYIGGIKERSAKSILEGNSGSVRREGGRADAVARAPGPQAIQQPPRLQGSGPSARRPAPTAIDVASLKRKNSRSA